jgi:cyclophilin family peptidyl-prolyl cis-trans isomerase
VIKLANNIHLRHQPNKMKLSLIIISIFLFGFLSSAQETNAEIKKGVYAHIHTNKGEIIAFLEYQNVPMTVSNFVGLAEGTIGNAAFGLGRPYYTNSKWHRVVPEHVIQGGSPDIQGRAGTGYSYPNEIYDGLSHENPGVLGIANAGPHTNGSQFYITLGDRSYLDGNYSLFGYVVEGMDVVYSIEQNDVIERIEIKRIGRKAERFKPVTRSFQKMVDKAKADLAKNEKEKNRLIAEYIATNYSLAKSDSNGITHQMLTEGNGELISQGTSVKIKYTGKVLLEELAFVSTGDAGKPLNETEPLAFDYEIGTSKINKGLDSIIPQMRLGEKRVVIVPPNMAYGRNGHYGPYKPSNQRFVINPSSTLLYEIEIIAVNN